MIMTPVRYTIRHNTLISRRLAAGLILLLVTIPRLAHAQQVQKLIASDGVQADYFGGAVSVSGDVILVGAHTYSDFDPFPGFAYVFRNKGGVWSEIQKLVPSKSQGGASCGTSVSVSGSVAILGCWRDNEKGLRSGSAYVFREVDGVWTEEQKLTASDGVIEDNFGISVAIHGDVAVVGSPRGVGDGVQSGTVYVFRYVDGLWTQEQELSPGAALEFQGFSRVALHDDLIIVGSFLDDDNGEDTGSAYVFRHAEGVWTEQQKLLASDGPPNAPGANFGPSFGRSVSTDGQSVIVGSQGGAYVFREVEGIWIEDAKLTASDSTNSPIFGDRVAIFGDMAIVGDRYGYSDGTQTGSAYLFAGMEKVWTEVQKLAIPDPIPGLAAGSSVAIGPDLAVVGAPFAEDNGPASGAVYVYMALPTDSRDEYPTAKETAVSGNYPNPFGPSTTIEFELAFPSHVRLEVFDLLGRRIDMIDDDVRTAGLNRMTFDSEHLPAGVYFYRLHTARETITRTMVKR